MVKNCCNYPDFRGDSSRYPGVLLQLSSCLFILETAVEPPVEGVCWPDWRREKGADGLILNVFLHSQAGQQGRSAGGSAVTHWGSPVN